MKIFLVLPRLWVNWLFSVSLHPRKSTDKIVQISINMTRSTSPMTARTWEWGRRPESSPKVETKDMKWASRRKTSIVWLLQYELPEIVTFIKSKSEMLVTRGWEGAWNGELLINSLQVSPKWENTPYRYAAVVPVANWRSVTRTDLTLSVLTTARWLKREWNVISLLKK